MVHAPAAEKQAVQEAWATGRTLIGYEFFMVGPASDPAKIAAAGSALDAYRRIAQALGTVGLLHKRRQNGLDLSSGETRRLGIARALVIEPEVFYLDEPTANLDQKNSDIIEEIIFSMKTAEKSTIIIVTHDPAQARRLGDQPLVMENGRIAPL